MSKYFYDGVRRDFHAAWVPQGGKVLVWIERTAESYELTGAQSCGGDYICTSYDLHKESTATDVYEIDLQTERRTHLWTIPYAVEQLGVSEDGHSIALVRAHETSLVETVWRSDGFRTLSDAWFTADQCALETRDYETGQVLTATPEAVCRTYYNPDGQDNTEDTRNYPSLGMGP